MVKEYGCDSFLKSRINRGRKSTCQQVVDNSPLGRFRTKNLGHFHVIFHSVVLTNIKRRFVSYSSHSTTIKTIYPLVVLREMPFSNEIDTKKLHDLEGFSTSHTT